MDSGTGARVGETVPISFGLGSGWPLPDTLPSNKGNV